MSTVIFYTICSFLLAGIVLIYAEAYRKEWTRAKRWRLKAMNIDFRDIYVYKLYLNFVEKKRGRLAEIEIHDAMSFMRNLIAIGEGGDLNSDSLIEQLISYKGLLSKYYPGVLHLLRQNQKDEAIQYFTKSVGTKFSEDFIRLIIRWDDIEPKQLRETLLSYQKNIAESRETSNRRKDEAISDLIYLPVVVNVMLVFLNFIYVGYFIDQREMLQMLL